MAASTFASMWADLAPIGRDPTTGGYRRFAWTHADETLRDWFTGEANARGLDVTADRAGNLWAWWGDAEAAAARGEPGIVLGSHLDSVPDGGAYDGPLGVVSAFLALDALRAARPDLPPSLPVGIAMFGDEEGGRFGIACAGSRVITGALSADRALALTDSDGTSMAEAITACGGQPQDVGRDDETLRRIGVFVELHVEQGRGLVDLDRAVAVGSSIRPHGRWRLDLQGRADHAGTTALRDRNDPMLDLAAVIIAARTEAAARDCVATVGKIVVEPNGVNAIPSHVSAWLDARGPKEADVRAVAAAVAFAGRSSATEESFTTTTHFDRALADTLSTLLDDAPVLATGAGHDAGVLASAGIPTAMLFVRNPTGISHSPVEHASVDDCLAGVAALTTVLTRLAT